MKEYNWRTLQDRYKPDDELWGKCNFCNQRVHQGVFHIHMSEEHPEIWKQFMDKNFSHDNTRYEYDAASGKVRKYINGVYQNPS